MEDAHDDGRDKIGGYEQAKAQFREYRPQFLDGLAEVVIEEYILHGFFLFKSNE
jgi:hypothetical protein